MSEEEDNVHAFPGSNRKDRDLDPEFFLRRCIDYVRKADQINGLLVLVMTGDKLTLHSANGNVERAISMLSGAQMYASGTYMDAINNGAFHYEPDEDNPEEPDPVPGGA